MNSKILLIAQGSQSIQLVRELFSLGYKPDGIDVITIDDSKNLSFIDFLDYYEIHKKYVMTENFNRLLISQLRNKYSIVISFSNPFIISKEAISKSIFLNFHPGWLPRYRGSLSTVHSLINEEKFVGGTWHYIVTEVDKGNIIYRFKIIIDSKDTAFSLNHKIFSKGIQSLSEILERVKNNYPGISQNNKNGRFYLNKFPSLSSMTNKKLIHKLTYFPPIFK
tara:strand:+ start:3388 stop:4053 length:666 start_codon:yes stop_codon:yes gene_type:complete